MSDSLIEGSLFFNDKFTVYSHNINSRLVRFEVGGMKTLR